LSFLYILIKRVLTDVLYDGIQKMVNEYRMLTSAAIILTPKNAKKKEQRNMHHPKKPMCICMSYIFIVGK
jgi:hypothetical protein